jgi:hypothetical protein
VLTDGDGIEVDLHWRLGTTPPPAMAADAIIARGESVELYGIPIRVAAPADAIALTVHHVLRDNFAPHSAVKDLGDLATWWQVHPQRWHLTEIVTHAQECGLTVPLLALWQILVSFDPSGAVRTGVTALAAAVDATARRDATRLQALFQRQLRGERLNEDLLRLLSPLVIARFVVRRLRDRGTARQLQTEMALPRGSYRKRAMRLLRHATRLNPTTIREYTALLRAHRNSQAARHSSPP